MGENYAVALAAERKRVLRIYQAYSSEARADHAASFRLGHRQRSAAGRFFYTHPDLPGIAFDTRARAAEAALQSKGEGQP